jgi:hypothetical protein
LIGKIDKKVLVAPNFHRLEKKKPTLGFEREALMINKYQCENGILEEENQHSFSNTLN